MNDRNATTNLDPRRIPAQERSKERVRRILDSTAELLVEYGVGFVTTARIAERAGVPIGSVYQYFPNKKAIFLALYEQRIASARLALEEYERDGPYAAGWEAFLRGMIVLLRRNRGDPRLQDALRVACQAYPELQDLDARLADALATPLARMLRRLGSRWSIAKLRRLALYSYYLNEAGLRYRREIKPPPREISAWADDLTLKHFGLCFEDQAGPFKQRSDQGRR
jgi:AcrR family transcriptional regulator